MGKKEGKGKYRFNDGRVYEGEWVDGKQHGKGRIVYFDGTVVEGVWK